MTFANSKNKKKLRIAMFFSSDPSKPGGVQDHIYHLSRELRRLGHQVTILGPEGKRFLSYVDYRSVIQALKVPLPNGNWSYISSPLNNKVKASFLVNKKDFDICHVHEPYIPFLSWQLLKEVKVPKVGTFHGAWDDGSIFDFLTPILPYFKKVFSDDINGVIYISRLAQERWQALCSKKIFQKAILIGVDHNVFQASKEKVKKEFYFLFLGRLVRRKGAIYLIKALVQLLDEFPKIKLIIVGEGKEEKRLKSFVKRKKLERNVVFTGRVSNKKKIEYYQNAGVFCAPYIDEGFGATILEAMACGCPIVGFKNKAFKETLGDYPAPELLVKHKDIIGLAKALKKVITDEKLRLKLRKWCIKESKKFSWQKNALETEKLYYKMID